MKLLCFALVPPTGLEERYSDGMSRLKRPDIHKRVLIRLVCVTDDKWFSYTIWGGFLFTCFYVYVSMVISLHVTTCWVLTAEKIKLK